MNDSRKQKLLLNDIYRTDIDDLLKLDIAVLRDLENQASTAVFSAAVALDFLRTVIAKKIHQQPANDA